jgi:hypothetical protein
VARIVILSFGDNDAAEHFVEGVLAAQDQDTSTEQLATEIMATGAIVSACSTIEAMVARPTAWCKCKIVGKSRGASRGKFSAMTESWYKSARFGWLIHRRCQRPHYFVVTRFIQNMVTGVGCNDLLPELKAKLVPKEEIVDNDAGEMDNVSDVRSVVEVPLHESGDSEEVRSSDLMSAQAQEDVVIEEPSITQ